VLVRIRQFAAQDKIALKKHCILRHCILRMYQRNISANEVQEVLVSGDLIETYEEDRPLPSCLIMDESKGRKIHLVVAVDLPDEMLWVVTVYEPSYEEWETDFRRRRLK